MTEDLIKVEGRKALRAYITTVDPAKQWPFLFEGWEFDAHELAEIVAAKLQIETTPELVGACWAVIQETEFQDWTDSVQYAAFEAKQPCWTGTNSLD
jgi:hypothetical protein